MHVGERLAVGTEAGDVLICDSSDLRATIHSVCSGEPITAVAPFGKACHPRLSLSSACLWGYAVPKLALSVAMVE